MSIKLEIIDSLDDFRAIKESWNQLYLESEESTIFLSWDWMFTWWEVFHTSLSSELFIICLYENNELIGLAPFHIVDSFPKSLIQGKTISFLGSGEESKDKIVSQYLDFLVKPSKKNEMVESVSRCLFESKNKWKFADFPFLLKDSVISNCFKNTDSQIHTRFFQYGHRFYIPDVQSFDSFLEKLGNRWSKMYQKKSRKLQNNGEIKIGSTHGDVASAKRAFHQLAEMHEARWKDRTEVNIFKSKLFNEFHLKILERLVPENKAYITSLCLDDKPLSSYYYFTDKSQIHYYQSGFYTENANKFSPLFLLVCKEIGLSIKNKFLFDFMFDENVASYKKEQYAAISKPMYRLMWSPHKSTLVKHDCAKALQSFYLKIKSS